MTLRTTKNPFPLLGLLFATLTISILTLAAPPESEPLTVKVSSFDFDIPGGTRKEQSLDAALVRTPDGTTWTTRGCPEWISLERSTVTLAPPPGAYRTESCSVEAQKGAAKVQVKLKVRTGVEPRWETSEIDLGVIDEDSNFTANLTPKASHPFKDVLTLTLVDANRKPSWMQFESGKLSGTPRRAHVGSFGPFEVRAKNQFGLEASVSVRGTVRKTVHPPRWVQKTIELGDTPEDTIFRLSVQNPKWIENSENADLKFRIVEGPKSSWLAVDSDKLEGTPRLEAVGKNTVELEAAATIDGQVYLTRVTFHLNVVHVFKTPVWKEKISIPPAVTQKHYSADLREFCEDPGRDRLSFRWKVPPAPWATLSADGKITGTPKNSDFGAKPGSIECTNGKLSAVAAITLEVGNQPPTWRAKPTELKPAKEDAPYAADLTGTVNDTEKDPVTFEKIDGPKWVTIAPSGKMAGTPLRADVGRSSLHVRVRDGISPGSDEATVEILVERTEKPAQWKPISLTKWPERDTLQFDLRPFVTDPDGDKKLIFSKVSGPSWMTVDAEGIARGIPARSNLGVNTFTLKVADQFKLSKDQTWVLEIEKRNRAPKIKTPGIELGTTMEDQAVSANLATSTEDEDGDKLRFSSKDLPPWLTLTQDGKLTGTPTAGRDLGPFQFRLAVADSDTAIETTVRGLVVLKNYPPEAHTARLSFQVKERAMLTTDLNQPEFFFDRNKDPMTFSLPGKETAWVSLSSKGELTLKPLFADVGDRDIAIRVSDGKATADAKVTVKVLRNPRPPVWNENALKLKTLAREPFQTNLGALVKDPDKLPLTITKRSGPAWVQVGSDGKVSGTPEDKDVGGNTVTVEAKNDQMSANLELMIDVLFKEHPPTLKPIALKPFSEREPLEADLLPFAVDPDGNKKLTFTGTCPSWLKLTKDGKLTGKPERAELGDHACTIKITDQFQLSAEGKFTVKVEKRNRRPMFLTQPILMPPLIEDQAVTFSFSAVAADADGDRLTFTAIGLPKWLTLSPDGKLSGTPAANRDLGPFQYKVKVSDGELFAEVEVRGSVILKNYPPVPNLTLWNTQLPERQSLQIRLDQSDYISDKNRDPLQFKLLSTSQAWVSLTVQGLLTLKPDFANLGDHKLSIQISDGRLTTDSIFHVKVTRNPRPPEWTQKSYTIKVSAREPFFASLATFAKDLDHLPIRFTKASGPAWVTVQPEGKLSGTPEDAHVGTHSISVQASNDGASSPAIIQLEVLHKNHPVRIGELKPIPLKERDTQEIELGRTPYVIEIDKQDTLTFRFTQAPTDGWATLTSDGKLKLAPQFKQVGHQKIAFEVSDGATKAVGELPVDVARAPRPPTWLSENAKITHKARVPFSLDLRTHVKDSDGLPISIQKKKLPDWLSLSNDGVLTGTPTDEAVGSHTLQFVAKNDQMTSEGELELKVEFNRKPPVWKKEQIQVGELRVGDTGAWELGEHAEDPDNLSKLKFSKVSGPMWAFVLPKGQLFGTPKNSDTGNAKVVIRATNDQGLSSDITLELRVRGQNRAPAVAGKTLSLPDIQIGELLLYDVSPLVRDADGDTLTFEKVDGPNWVTVGRHGEISGVPPSGWKEYAVNVQIDDGRKRSTVRLQGRVKPPPPGAKPKAGPAKLPMSFKN